MKQEVVLALTIAISWMASVVQPDLLGERFRIGGPEGISSSRPVRPALVEQCVDVATSILAVP